MEECFYCSKEIKEDQRGKKRGKHVFHIKCLRKVRKVAKKKFNGNLDRAIEWERLKNAVL